MKYFFSFISATLFLLAIACKKSSQPPGTASLNIVNTVMGSSGLVTNFTSENADKSSESFSYHNSLDIDFGSFQEIGYYFGATPLLLAEKTDTNNIVFRGQLNLPIGSVHTLFMTGTLTQPDTVFTEDHIPYYPYTGDTVTGLRFINSSPVNRSIVITLQSDSGHNPIGNALAYKTVTNFQSYSANSTAQSAGYSFEFRDAVSDSLLATFPLNIVSYKSQTLVFYGTDSTGLSVMAVNNF